MRICVECGAAECECEFTNEFDFSITYFVNGEKREKVHITVKAALEEQARDMAESLAEVVAMSSGYDDEMEVTLTDVH